MLSELCETWSFVSYWGQRTPVTQRTDDEQLVLLQNAVERPAAFTGLLFWQNMLEMGILTYVIKLYKAVQSYHHGKGMKLNSQRNSVGITPGGCGKGQ